MSKVKSFQLWRSLVCNQVDRSRLRIQKISSYPGLNSLSIFLEGSYRHRIKIALATALAISATPWWCFRFLTNKKVGRSVRKLANQILRTEIWDWKWQVFLFWRIWQKGKFESIDETNIPHGVNEWLGYKNWPFTLKRPFSGCNMMDFQLCFMLGAKQKTVCIVVPSAKVKVQSVFFGFGSTQSIKPWLVV